MKLRRLVALVAITIAIPVWSSPFDIDGKVVYADDGDTVVLLTSGNEQLKVRLSSIDVREFAHST